MATSGTSARGGRRLQAALWALALTVATTIAAVGAPAMAQTSASGALSRANPDFPNFFYDNYRYELCHPRGYSCNNDSASLGNTAVFADPANGVAFEWNFDYKPDYPNHPCGYSDQAYPYGFITYDIDTYQVKAQGCLPAGLAYFPFPQGVGVSKAPFVAVDSTDHLLFLSSDNLDKILAISEDTMQVVATWTLPPGTGTLDGFSWYAPTDQLVVMADAGTIASYDIASSLSKGSGQLAWSYQVQSCVGPLNTYYATAHPYRSLDLPAVFVPCKLHTFHDEITGHLPLESTNPPGVVKVTLGPDGAPSTTEPEKAVVTPGYHTSRDGAADFLFDPGSDRGFQPVNGNSSADVYVYDGKVGEFIGQANIASNNSGNTLSIALDERTGRFYAAGIFGIFALDGRRTPVSPGDRYDASDFAAGGPNWTVLPVLPPTKTKPYTRVLTNYKHDLPATNQVSVLNYFTVLADGRPVQADPPPDQVDKRTYNGEVEPGASLATSYFAGGARGFGAHSYLVGGAGGIINNLINNPNYAGLGSINQNIASNFPYASYDRDLLAGYVSKVSLKNGSSEGQAAALGDGNGQTANTLGSLTTSAYSDNNGHSSPEITRQLWPYPNATCSYPGTTPGTRAGYYYTRWDEDKDAEGNPLPTQHNLPSNDTYAYDKHAYAQVDCPEQKAVAGQARFMQLDLSTDNAQGLPSISVASGSVTTTVVPPTTNKGIAASAIAQARGIKIDLGEGNILNIGEVIQTATATAAGRPGTAHAARQVTVYDLALNGMVLCGDGDSGCSKNQLQTQIDYLNDQFYNKMHIFIPPAYDALLKGTPGGYKATVEPTPLQQSGDEGFNHFTVDEATILPGMRILLNNDGWQLSREILDLAGIGLDTQMAVELVPPDELPPLPIVDAYEAAGVAGVPGYTQYIPGPDGSASSSSALAANAYPVSSRGIVGVLKKVFQGFAAVMRSPGAALQMFAFLALLAAPMLITSRRRLSLDDLGARA